MTRIACQQLAPELLDLEANRRDSTAAIRDAVASGADIVVLPELVTSGYVFESSDEAASVAITSEHSIFHDWATELSRAPDRSPIAVGGFCERGEDGLVYNSAAVVDRSGITAVYRKAHLWDREKLFFEPGADVPPIIDTPFGRIGVLICYDLEFPEMTRGLALAGADLIAVPTNWPLSEWPGGEHPPEVVIAMATARVNRVFVACCDRTGTERGQAWTAGTSVIDEAGWIVAGGRGTAAVADVDLNRARSKSFTGLADAFEDRRPDVYEAAARSRTSYVSTGLVAGPEGTISLRDRPPRAVGSEPTGSWP
ncbi:MAG: hypothetical protein JO240_17590 [Solirubrobacterales bacterium]|nr:hypothetical protein [Solirubrobacterales bacterium]